MPALFLMADYLRALFAARRSPAAPAAAAPKAAAPGKQRRKAKALRRRTAPGSYRIDPDQPLFAQLHK